MKTKALILAALTIAAVGIASSAHADTISFHSGNGNIGDVDSQITMNGGNTYVINPNPAWPSLAGANWVSSFSNGNIDTRGQLTNAIDDVYTLSFDLPSFSLATFSMDYSGDNHTVSILLNGQDISAPSVDYGHLAHVDTNSFLLAGSNTLTFTVIDDGGPVGLLFNGEVTTSTPAAAPLPASATTGGIILASLAIAQKLRRRLA